MIKKERTSPPNMGLAQLRQELNQHHWSFLADNYRDLKMAIAAESRLYVAAQHHGVPGVQAYIRTMRRANTALKQISPLKQQILAVIQAKMPVTPEALQRYQQRCLTHDWQFERADDFKVWKKERAIHVELLALASAYPEYRRIWNEVARTKSTIEGMLV